MTRCVLLDIDDVLLTARAHVLPTNLARIEIMAAGKAHGLDLLDALPLTFDPIAVAWLNRLTLLTSAKIVVHSSWRNQFSGEEIRAHLLSQGVTGESLHDDLCCPGGPMSNKANDIEMWLSEHPEVSRWVCIDDDKAVGHGLKKLGLIPARRNTVPKAAGCFIEVDPAIGFGPRDYRTALEHFGIRDVLPMKGSV